MRELRNPGFASSKGIPQGIRKWIAFDGVQDSIPHIGCLVMLNILSGRNEKKMSEQEGHSDLPLLLFLPWNRSQKSPVLGASLCGRPEDISTKDRELRGEKSGPLRSSRLPHHHRPRPRSLPNQVFTSLLCLCLKGINTSSSGHFLRSWSIYSRLVGSLGHNPDQDGVWSEKWGSLVGLRPCLGRWCQKGVELVGRRRTPNFLVDIDSISELRDKRWG